jgi:hypothetical protein
MNKPQSADPIELFRFLTEREADSVPVGAVMPIYGRLSNAWLPADNRVLLIQAYPGLHAQIGRAFVQNDDHPLIFRVPLVTLGGLPWSIKCL